MRLEIASHITISAKLFAGLSVIVSSPPSPILRCETISLPLARMHRSLDIMRATCWLARDSTSYGKMPSAFGLASG